MRKHNIEDTKMNRRMIDLKSPYYVTLADVQVEVCKADTCVRAKGPFQEVVGVIATVGLVAWGLSCLADAFGNKRR